MKSLRKPCLCGLPNPMYSYECYSNCNYYSCTGKYWCCFHYWYCCYYQMPSEVPVGMGWFVTTCTSWSPPDPKQVKHWNWHISRQGGRGGGQLLKAKPGPKTQSIRPKIPKNSSVTEIAEKRFTKEKKVISSTFLDLSSIFLNLSSIFLDLHRSSLISPRSLDLHWSPPIFLDLPWSSSIFPWSSSILESARRVLKGVITVSDPTATFGNWNKYHGNKIPPKKYPPTCEKFICTSFSEQFLLGSWLVSQGRR